MNETLTRVTRLVCLRQHLFEGNGDKASLQGPYAQQDAPTPLGYGIAIVAVVGAAFILPPFPLLFLGIITCLFLAVVVVLGFLLLRSIRSVRSASRNRARLYTWNAEEHPAKHLSPEEQHIPVSVMAHSHVPVSASHAGMVSDR